MKIAVIGLDGCSYSLVEQFINEGLMPNFNKLRKHGFYSRLNSTNPPHTAPGWVSSITGTNPGKHGIYSFWDTQNYTYGNRILGSKDIGLPTIWEILNEAGYQTGVINVPMTHPPKGINGFQITWPLVNTLRYSDPPNLIYEIQQQCGNYYNDLYTMYHNENNYDEKAVLYTKKRKDVVNYLIENKSWDFFMVVFTEIDRICHQYWNELSNDTKSLDPIRKIYQETDNVIGDIIQKLSQDTKLLIYSDHGFCKGYLDFNIQYYFMRHGLMSMQKKEKDNKNADWFCGEKENVQYTVDWEKTVAYLAAPYSYGININLYGRQQYGIVAQNDYEKTRQNIIELLMRVEEPENGNRLFKNIYRREEIYKGCNMLQAPDLIVEPYDYGVTLSHNIFSGEIFKYNPEQSGMHAKDGMFLFWDPEDKYRLMSPSSLEDITPTVLQFYKTEIPNWMDGNGLLIENNSSSLRKEETNSIQNEEITRRLKNLGYL